MMTGGTYMFNFLSSSWLEMVRCYILHFSLGFSREMIGRLRHVPLPSPRETRTAWCFRSHVFIHWNQYGSVMVWKKYKKVYVLNIFQSDILEASRVYNFLYAIKGIFLIGKMMIFTGGRGTGYHSWPDSDWLDAPCDTSGFSSRPGFRETSWL